MLYPLATSDTRLDRIVEAIVGRVHPIRVILLGGRGRGNARPNSDYDIEVEMGFGRIILQPAYAFIRV